MKVFQETTDWGNASAVNHIYFLSDSKDKMYAYINKEGCIDEVKTPYRFHVRGRKFKEIPNRWGFKPRAEAEPESEPEAEPTVSAGDALATPSPPVATPIPNATASPPIRPT
jgi:hypothetical protein